MFFIGVAIAALPSTLFERRLSFKKSIEARRGSIVSIVGLTMALAAFVIMISRDVAVTREHFVIILLLMALYNDRVRVIVSKADRSNTIE